MAKVNKKAKEKLIINRVLPKSRKPKQAGFKNNNKISALPGFSNYI